MPGAPFWITGTLVAAPFSRRFSRGDGVGVCDRDHSTVVMNPKARGRGKGVGGLRLRQTIREANGLATLRKTGFWLRSTREKNKGLTCSVRPGVLCGIGSRRHGCGASKAEVRSERERPTQSRGRRPLSPAPSPRYRRNRWVPGRDPCQLDLAIDYG